MKHFVAPALVLAIVAVFVLGRSVIVTAQQPEREAPAPAFPIALPTPAAGFNPPIASVPPDLAVPMPPTVATLNDLVRALKDVRQKKAELQQEEEKLTAEIRKKIADEKKVHEEVLRLIGTPDGQEPKANDVRRPEKNVDDESPRNDALPKQRGENRVPDGLPK
jgi:hypothetical protein